MLASDSATGFQRTGIVVAATSQETFAGEFLVASACGSRVPFTVALLNGSRRTTRSFFLHPQKTGQTPAPASHSERNKSVENSGTRNEVGCRLRTRVPGRLPDS